MMRSRRRRTLDIEGKDEKLQEKVPNISYFTLYRFASRKDRTLIAISLIAAFLTGMTVPYSITLVAETFQNMITYTVNVQKGNDNSEDFLTKMHRFGTKYSCIGFVSFLGAYLGSALMNVTAIDQVHKIRRAYLRAALNQDVAYYDERPCGGFASRMADDVIKVGQGIGDKVSAGVYSLTVGVCCIIMSLVKGWKLALLCLTSTPVTLILVGITGKVANRLAKQQTMASSRASAVAQEVLSSIRTVYSFNGQGKELERYKKPLEEERRTYIKKEFFSGLSIGFLMFCVFSSYALFFYLGVYLIINDPAHYNADVMFSVFFGVMTAMGNIGMVGSLVGTFGSARGSGAYIFHLVDSKPTINPLANTGIKLSNAKGEIELKNVVFHYPSRPTVQVLKGVNITVKQGQSVALVGQSGCGKSSIIQLICRYYDVLDGSICIDGHDIRTLSVRWLRAQIGLVGQEPVLFNSSVRDNIRYGRDDATDDDIEAAAKIANSHHFIVKLPMGYDTNVGDRGASLSGGQKQRIALARALVKNPLILLLDEATSALDTNSEAKVQIALDQSTKGRTTIVVAHRLSTIRNVDVIYAMKDGQITEVGSHDELMAKKGQYYEMVHMQDPAATAPDVEIKDLPKEQSKISKSSEEEYHIENVKTVLDEDKETKAPKLSFWRVVRLNSPEWKSISIGSIGSLFIGFSLPLFILVFGDIFGTLSDPDTNKLWERVQIVSLICVIIGLVMGVSNVIEAGSFGIAGAYLTERLRVRMFAHMLQQHLAYFDERANSTGALCARLSAEAAYVQGATGQRIGISLQALGSVGLALAISMIYEWRVGLVVWSFCPIIVTVIYYQAKATHKESTGNAETLEGSTKIAVEAVSNIRTVVSLGREHKFLEEYMAQLEPTLTLARRSAHFHGLVAGMSRSMFIFVNSIALTYGGHLIVSDGVACQNILVTTQAMQVTSNSAQNALTFAPDFQKGIDAASRIVAFLKTKPKLLNPEVPAVMRFVCKGEAALKQVEFNYPSRPNVPVLCGLDLNIESGKTTALVGRSGCGKSTIFQMLQRFYDPDRGGVYLDGIPLPDLLINEVRSSFGLVSQEPVLFAGSIRENIEYGDNSRRVTDEEVFTAARQANIHEFIVQLPMGYNTEIGAKGVQLSGGQKQRVAIARALIRNPKILLLDEATSALDTESEKVVTAALANARVGRTCVVIAHRLSTTRGADRVLVLKGGRVLDADHEHDHEHEHDHDHRTSVEQK